MWARIPGPSSATTPWWEGKGEFCSLCFIWFVCLSTAATRVTYHSTNSFAP